MSEDNPTPEAAAAPSPGEPVEATPAEIAEPSATPEPVEAAPTAPSAPDPVPPSKFGDAFRTTYRELSPIEKQAIQDAKTLAQALHDHLATFPAGREVALAKTKLEEAVMWAVKGLTG